MQQETGQQPELWLGHIPALNSLCGISLNATAVGHEATATFLSTLNSLCGISLNATVR
jgi:hypothetical protein